MAVAKGDHEDGQEQHAHGDGMTADQRRQMDHDHHRRTLWVYWSLILLGAWMAVSPFLLGHANPALWVDPSGGRGVWFSDQTHTALRAQLMTWSDVASGLLLVLFGWRALRPNRPVSLWLCAGVGAWLSLAPVLFWAPTAAAYHNATLVGMLVIALAILVPGMPNMIRYMRMGPPTPPGWSYNPSSWPQRAIMIGLAFLGWLASRHLAAYQMGYSAGVWEPFFGAGSSRVLDSDMSHAWPVSDAALGTFAFTFEFLMGWMGGPARWRTMPWMVTFFGILVIPLGLVHIALVISQPVIVGAWCTFCLLAAALMLPMIPLEADEVVAMGQHVKGARARGESVWRTFWKGGSPEGGTPDERTPALMRFPDAPLAVTRAALFGMSAPWSLIAATALGILVMALPGIFDVAGGAATVWHLGGALAVVTAVVAMGEPLRLLRWLNVPIGLAIALLPWIHSAPLTARIAALIAGLGIASLGIPRGHVRESFGSWNRWVR